MEVKRKYYLVHKTKPLKQERQEKDRILHQEIKGKYSITNNTYVSIVEYFGEMSMRNKVMIGQIVNDFSVLLKIGRKHIIQMEDGQTIEVNQYDKTVIDLIAKIIPIEVLKSSD